jgi:hypothetical protein
MLRRLKGTQIETNIVTGGEEQTKGFGWIHDYTITKKTGNGKGVLECIVQISDWMYNALLHYEVLTIDRRYFALRMPLERRLYELARKHVGNKAIWGRFRKRKIKHVKPCHTWRYVGPLRLPPIDDRGTREAPRQQASQPQQAAPEKPPEKAKQSRSRASDKQAAAKTSDPKQALEPGAFADDIPFMDPYRFSWMLV